jgi:hypothetical protein
MRGIELSRRFYLDIVRPWLLSIAPDLRHAAALIGYGSELLGFDDAMSRDHNWGPRVHLFLTQADFKTYAERLVAEFSDIAPSTFLGEPIGWRSRPHPPAGGAEALGVLEHGLEVHTLEGTLERMLGIGDGEKLTPITWLGFAEQRLLAFTAGAVFHDDDGRLTGARQQLAYFPDDVWLYKVACQWRRISEEQAFVGRTGLVGDELGSRVIAARLVRDVMRMGFLLDRRYAPYAKWFGSAFAGLPCAGEMSTILARVLDAADWKTREGALASAYLVLARRQLASGAGRKFQPAVRPYFGRPFMTINADTAIEATLAAIVSPDIRALPVVASLDQVTDLTPLLEDPHQSHAVMDALLGS